MKGENRMPKLLLATFLLFIVATFADAQVGGCLKCASGQCIQTHLGWDLCTTGGIPPCTVAGGDPCDDGAGGGAQCYYDGQDWVCDAVGVQKADVIRAHKLFHVWTAGQFDNQTVHLTTCSALAAVILTEYQSKKLLHRDPKDYHKFWARTVTGKVYFEIHEPQRRTSDQE